MNENFNINNNSNNNNKSCKNDKKQLDINYLSAIERKIFELPDIDLMHLAGFFNEDLIYHDLCISDTHSYTYLINNGLCTREETNIVRYGVFCKYTYSLNTEVIEAVKSLNNKGYLTYQSKTFSKKCK